MHVVIVAHTRHPVRQPFAGGLESVSWHLTRGLAERGHRVSVFAARGSDRIPGVEHLWPDELPLSDAARADVSMPDEGWLRRHHAYLSLMLQLARRDDIDLVHTHALHHLPTAMAPTLPVPTLLSLHTPPTPWLESAIRIALAGDRAPSLHATAVSAHTARAWEHVVRAQVVRNGVDTEVWRAGDGGGPLVWSGRIVPEKAPHVAVRIAREAGLPLVLAGPVADEDYARSVLWPLCDDDAVTYAGHLSDTALAALVGAASAALVTPAWDEPFGLVAAEALACGTPVLGLRRGGLPEVVGPEVGRLVSPEGGEDEVVARGAAALPEVLGLSRAACRAVAESEHSMDRMVDGYLAVYGSIVPERSSSLAPLPAPGAARPDPLSSLRRPVGPARPGTPAASPARAHGRAAAPAVDLGTGTP
ncbi:glycosyltransferase [Ornithinimicrobium pekingense]|uniref:D-inositol 3-phosphate glycosyltransferase n=1 Tax=Ornithinimicrobium pekingense TaxID=384677 RepID=A0ABQ2F6I3_9MICO|nr:glycosyltransferase [Ornithinimicrobium pekingense]GGK57594.1 glycosyl transferase family 1 [Ornithinimicrobium pekingense]